MRGRWAGGPAPRGASQLNGGGRWDEPGAGAGGAGSYAASAYRGGKYRKDRGGGGGRRGFQQAFAVCCCVAFVLLVQRRSPTAALEPRRRGGQRPARTVPTAEDTGLDPDRPAGDLEPRGRGWRPGRGRHSGLGPARAGGEGGPEAGPAAGGPLQGDGLQGALKPLKLLFQLGDVYRVVRKDEVKPFCCVASDYGKGLKCFCDHDVDVAFVVRQDATGLLSTTTKLVTEVNFSDYPPDEKSVFDAIAGLTEEKLHGYYVETGTPEYEVQVETFEDQIGNSIFSILKNQGTVVDMQDKFVDRAYNEDDRPEGRAAAMARAAEQLQQKQQDAAVEGLERAKRDRERAASKKERLLGFDETDKALQGKIAQAEAQREKEALRARNEDLAARWEEWDQGSSHIHKVKNRLKNLYHKEKVVQMEEVYHPRKAGGARWASKAVRDAEDRKRAQQLHRHAKKTVMPCGSLDKIRNLPLVARMHCLRALGKAELPEPAKTADHGYDVEDFVADRQAHRPGRGAGKPGAADAATAKGPTDEERFEDALAGAGAAVDTEDSDLVRPDAGAGTGTPA